MISKSRTKPRLKKSVEELRKKLREIEETKEKEVKEKALESKEEEKEEIEWVAPGWFKKTLFTSITLFFLIVAGTTLFLFSYFRSGSSNVVLQIDAPDEVFRGVPFDVQVNISNETDSLLTNAELALSSGEGIVNLGLIENGNRGVDAVGDLGGGSLTKRNYRFLASGKTNEIKEISFRLVYFTGGRSRFEVSKKTEVKIKGEPIELAIKKPEQALPGSSYVLNITYKNISDFDLPETSLQIKYPDSFNFSSASLTPDSLNNFWRLGEVKAGSSGNLEVRGLFESTGETNALFELIFQDNFLGKEYPVAEKNLEVGIAPAPVNINVLINRRSDYVARIGDRLAYTIEYKNSSGIALADVVIKAGFTGELFDLSSLITDGLVDLSNRTVTWDASRIPALRLLDAGASGEVNVGINLKNIFPIDRLNDKNFTLRFKAEITSPSVPYYLETSRTRAETSLETKVAGQITVDAKGFYRDAAAKILNNGPMPPKASQPTEYSLHWLIRNYSTDVKDVVVQTTLPANAVWTGLVKSNTDSVPMYNETKREVTWNMDVLKATKGILDSPVEAVFQVRVTPQLSDLGRFHDIIGQTTLRATDDFTGLELTSSDVAINSSLPDDITIGQGGGKVTP